MCPEVISQVLYLDPVKVKLNSNCLCCFKAPLCGFWKPACPPWAVIEVLGCCELVAKSALKSQRLVQNEGIDRTSGLLTFGIPLF